MPATNQQDKKPKARFLPLFIAVVSIAAALFIAFNRQYVIDQLAFWQFQPSADIQALATRAEMTDHSKFYFYASNPSLEDAKSFNDNCKKQEEGTAILGCYTGPRIFIYNVSNQQLDGMKEVTAAHEMLHAAYDRLSEQEKSRVNTLIEAEYANLREDERFAERMAFYERTEPGERDNELHSIIGTEVASIGDELEAYFGRYFKDRAKVVALHQSYAVVFEQLEARSKELADNLATLADDINAKTASYNQAIAQLNTDITSFNQRASDGDFTSDSQFQSERSDLIRRTATLDGERDAINADVDRFTTMKEELAAIASQSDALNRSIDSTLAPAPSL